MRGVKGFLKRSIPTIPVVLVKSAKASMIAWKLEVEDVTCRVTRVDDMMN